MRNLLALVGAGTITFLGLGWYLDWYRVSWLPSAPGRQSLKVDVNPEKITEDVKKGIEKGGRSSTSSATTRPTSPRRSSRPPTTSSRIGSTPRRSRLRPSRRPREGKPRAGSRPAGRTSRPRRPSRPSPRRTGVGSTSAGGFGESLLRAGRRATSVARTSVKSRTTRIASQVRGDGRFMLRWWGRGMRTRDGSRGLDVGCRLDVVADEPCPKRMADPTEERPRLAS